MWTLLSQSGAVSVAVKKCALRYMAFGNVVLRCTGQHSVNGSWHLMSDLYLHGDPDNERQVQIHASDPCAWRAGDIMKGKMR